MKDSFGGIEEPEGDSGGLSRAAGDMARQSSNFSGLSAQLRALPGSLGTWQGPASVAFAGSSLAYADDAAAASNALDLVSNVVQRWAAELAAAQAEARRALEAARQAQRDIDRAEKDLSEARSRAAAAQQVIDTVPGAQLLLADAQAAEKRAQTALNKAREDLSTARADGRKARERASDAARNGRQGLQIELGLRGASGQGIESFIDGYLEFVNVALNGAGGALASAPRLLRRARADAEQGRRKSKSYNDRRGNPTDDPDVRRAYDERYRAANNQVERSKAKMPQLKTMRNVGRVLLPLGAAIQFAGNAGKMSTGENLTRTGLSTAFAAGGGALGAVCGPAAAVCGAGLAVGGAAAGNWLGGFAYDDIVKPLGG